MWYDLKVLDTSQSNQKNEYGFMVLWTRVFHHASPLDGRDSLFGCCVVGKPFKKTVWSRHLFLFYFKREKQNKKEKP